ncbi:MULTISPECIES: ribosomal protection-like ABC-F family protein [unclassified Oceanispirochaeta]|uniref:ribosomal protection-like ABC-F family protein n=1 Tax=unclassified Oceanispirochaeta TaxID=2635722 RepID=UPI001314BA63|nr:MULTISPECIES: ABC-F family ATP-binding cassette domain-containing protein [unclassified Oceanispirochaeta]MBF9017526.1 ABC-F family ATP-binding cassette domain-containing protein [Oceanispirochaeta sp. M2]NPD74098.1 ABC-F family ATP-binding cassette domain-containing protein [Oceanispirochaeta sp. M1]
MDLIKAINLNLNTGSKDLLIDANFRILEGHKYGLIGANGTGKTTLVRLIMDEIEADKGSLIRKKNLKTGYVPQQPLFDQKQSIEEFLLRELSSLLTEMKLLEEQMSSTKCTENPAALEKVLSRYQRICDDFESRGGYQAQEKGEILIRRLGMDNLMTQSMGSLSGGERSLVFFAKALLVEPELLILDEPGNHLDYLGLAWLESFLAAYPGAVLIVSHNRYLLEKTCTTLLDLYGGTLREFTGRYSDYKTDRLRGALVEQNAYETSRKMQDKLVKRIKELQSIAMSQYNPPASVMSQLAAAQKKLADEKQKNLKKPQLEDDPLKLNFGDENTRSRIALQVKDFNWSFADRILFNKASLEINSREKVALVGANGSGKSTFLNVLLNQGDWDNKTLRLGPSQVIGFLSQTPEFNKNALTIEDEIRSWGPLTKDGAFNIARNFSFIYEDLEKRLAVLSGGEVNRLQLARLMYMKTNFLILDEPTNHMDIRSREMIEEAIGNFSGTVLVVSHDRYFLDQLVDRVIEIDQGQFNSYEGNFSEYFKNKYPVLPRLSGKIKSRGRERKTDNPSADFNNRNMERRIQEAEDEKSRLERELEKAFAAKDLKKGKKIAGELDKLSSRLEKMYSQWLK